MAGDWALVNVGELAFGTRATGYPLITPPLVEYAEGQNTNTDQPRGDGYVFGTKQLRGMSITAQLRIEERDEAAALAATEPLRAAWRADALRRAPGAVAELRAPSGRSAIGRPERFAAVDTALHIGRRQVLTTFEALTDLWYGPEEQHEVQLVSTSSGAFEIPMQVPLLLAAGDGQSSAFTVGGQLPTDHVVLEVLGGSILNPVVEVVGALRIETQVLVPFDLPLVHDARPWARTTLLGDGSAAGARTRASTRLADVALAPGAHHLRLSGQAIGNPRLRIRWRPAFPTY